jgi:hypothetical protein
MRNNYNKKKFLLMVLLLFVIGLGIGYAILTQQLTINNTVNYGSMKWNVGFVNAYDATDEIASLYEDGDEFVNELVPVDVSLSDDKKTLNITGDFGLNTSRKYVNVVATIKNDSTFNVVLDDFGFEENNDELQYFLQHYLEATHIYWFESFEDGTQGEVSPGDILLAGETKKILVTFDFFEIDEYNLPTSGYSINLSIAMDWEEITADLIGFKINESTYYAEVGMTWQQWVDSEYNRYGFIFDENGWLTKEYSCSHVSGVDADELIVEGTVYQYPPC